MSPACDDRLDLLDSDINGLTSMAPLEDYDWTELDRIMNEGCLQGTSADLSSIDLDGFMAPTAGAVSQQQVSGHSIFPYAPQAPLLQHNGWFDSNFQSAQALPYQHNEWLPNPLQMPGPPPFQQNGGHQSQLHTIEAQFPEIGWMPQSQFHMHHARPGPDEAGTHQGIQQECQAQQMVQEPSHVYTMPTMPQRNPNLLANPLYTPHVHDLYRGWPFPNQSQILSPQHAPDAAMHRQVMLRERHVQQQHHDGGLQEQHMLQRESLSRHPQHQSSPWNQRQRFEPQTLFTTPSFNISFSESSHQQSALQQSTNTKLSRSRMPPQGARQFQELQYSGKPAGGPQPQPIVRVQSKTRRNTPQLPCKSHQPGHSPSHVRNAVSVASKSTRVARGTASKRPHATPVPRPERNNGSRECSEVTEPLIQLQAQEGSESQEQQQLPVPCSSLHTATPVERVTPSPNSSAGSGGETIARTSPLLPTPQSIRKRSSAHKSSPATELWSPQRNATALRSTQRMAFPVPKSGFQIDTATSPCLRPQAGISAVAPNSIPRSTLTPEEAPRRSGPLEVSVDVTNRPRSEPLDKQNCVSEGWLFSHKQCETLANCIEPDSMHGHCLANRSNVRAWITLHYNCSGNPYGTCKAPWDDAYGPWGCAKVIQGLEMQLGRPSIPEQLVSTGFLPQPADGGYAELLESRQRKFREWEARIQFPWNGDNWSHERTLEGGEAAEGLQNGFKGQEALPKQQAEVRKAGQSCALPDIGQAMPRTDDYRGASSTATGSKRRAGEHQDNEDVEKPKNPRLG